LKDCPFRYQGQYEDSETGLYYNRFRYYDPSIGNYLSQDPIGLNGGMQLYSYVHNPNAWTDILGLKEEILTSGTVYRGGSGTLNNLTPAPKDAITGLSTVIEKPASGKFQTIDIAKLQGTGLEAVKDGKNHVSIRPTDDPDMKKIAEWTTAKGTDTEHELSKAVKMLVINDKIK
jgi:RHS repeat-associated protein